MSLKGDLALSVEGSFTPICPSLSALHSPLALHCWGTPVSHYLFLGSPYDIPALFRPHWALLCGWSVDTHGRGNWLGLGVQEEGKV